MNEIAAQPDPRPGPAQAVRTALGQAGERGREGRVRLGTLNNLRWLAVAGQSVAIVVVHFGLGYRLPIVLCAAAIVMSVLVNIILSFAYPASRRVPPREATVYLAYDIVQLAALLYLTGGIENPFSLLFVAPVVIAAATLNLENTLILAALSFIAASIIAVTHEPLPWAADEPLVLPALYQGGIWVSLVIGIGFTSIYAWRIASEAARMSAALAATQLALAREHRLAALGALATAAAHELGTPLGTIAVVARELSRELPEGSPHGEDMKLLRAEAERCREILTRLARPEIAVLGAVARLPLGALLDDIAGRHRGDDLDIAISCIAGSQPRVWRVPEIQHGLDNLVGNAADFARTRVEIHAGWDGDAITVTVADDGPGFSPEILEKIGEPYVTSRPGLLALGERDFSPAMPFAGQAGMGLGFFIAKTLIEQTGGTVTARNRPTGGALVTVTWPRGAIDGDEAPGTLQGDVGNPGA